MLKKPFNARKTLWTHLVTTYNHSFLVSRNGSACFSKTRAGTSRGQGLTWPGWWNHFIQFCRWLDSNSKQFLRHGLQERRCSNLVRSVHHLATKIWKCSWLEPGIQQRDLARHPAKTLLTSAESSVASYSLMRDFPRWSESHKFTIDICKKKRITSETGLKK